MVMVRVILPIYVVLLTDCGPQSRMAGAGLFAQLNAVCSD